MRLKRAVFAGFAAAALLLASWASADPLVPTNPATSSGGGGTPGGSSGQLQTNNGAGGFGAVAAPVGAVVGATDTQTLTNKSIAGSEINSGAVPLAQMPTVFGMPPYITGASMWYPNPYQTGAMSTSSTSSANQYLCVPFWIVQSVTIKALGIVVVATSTGNSSSALQGAIYNDLLTTGNVHRPGTLIDYADNAGAGTGFPTGSAASVSATMHNTTDALTGPSMVWTCVQRFDATATYVSMSIAGSSNLIAAALGSATLSTVLAASGSSRLNTVSANGSGYGGANWVNFTNSTSWTEQSGGSFGPAMAIQVN